MTRKRNTPAVRAAKAKQKAAEGKRTLNSYNASPDGKCEWCMKSSDFLECNDCFIYGPDVDSKVKIEPMRLAKCGHFSHQYYHCIDCLPFQKKDQDTCDLYNFSKQVQQFDLRKVGSTYATGLNSDPYGNGLQSALHQVRAENFENPTTEAFYKPVFIYSSFDAVNQDAGDL